ncbi:hypothetical protein GIY21_12925 [Xanthomonas sontii]|uniref:Uncharacterized protein n=1 Tax=Xanthomonas sontii TaxID=2650745 RepID=A0A6N7QDR0_9XANT|nr:hypothetical protein [Xanthomonas sontii]MRH01191.1 hypothetical protein [Xanthomonas sontii]MRH75372.1 hypothetical protein [Xanthomonas sontii]
MSAEFHFRLLREIMPLLSYLPIVIFAVVIANYGLLPMKIRKTLDSRQLKAPGLERFRFGGSPPGILLNVFRLRKAPEINDISESDLVAIHLHRRFRQFPVALLVTCIVVLVLCWIAPLNSG